ncbi:Cyclin-dependent kinase 17, partial [Cichlidogyrus casuarinus]
DLRLRNRASAKPRPLSHAFPYQSASFDEDRSLGMSTSNGIASSRLSQTTSTGLGTTLPLSSSQRTSALLDERVQNRDSSMLSMVSSPDVMSSQLSDDSSQISPVDSDLVTRTRTSHKSAFHAPQRLSADHQAKAKFSSPQHNQNQSSRNSSSRTQPYHAQSRSFDACKLGSAAPLARGDPSKRPVNNQLSKAVNRISLNGSGKALTPPPPVPFHQNGSTRGVSSPLASETGDFVQCSPNAYLDPGRMACSSSGSSSTHLQNRLVAGTIIHEENEDDNAVEATRQIEQSDLSPTGIDQLDPMLASAVLQASTRTGTSAAELINSLSEVKRRPTDARNRLRRLGGQHGDREETTSQRLSLPASINIPLHLRHKALSLFNDPMTKHERRKSLVSCPAAQLN